MNCSSAQHPCPRDYDGLRELGIRLIINMRLVHGPFPDPHHAPIRRLWLRTIDSPFCSDPDLQADHRVQTKGPDQFLESYKRAVDPPLASIFGTYYGTGKCATDERKSEFCRENRVTDYIIVERNDSGGARVTIGSAKRPDESEDYLCVRDAYAMWFDNRLVVAQETPEHPGGPHALQFGFKGNNVVLNSLWGNHCGSYFQGAVFQRRPVQSGGDVRR